MLGAPLANLGSRHGRIFAGPEHTGKDQPCPNENPAPPLLFGYAIHFASVGRLLPFWANSWRSGSIPFTRSGCPLCSSQPISQSLIGELS